MAYRFINMVLFCSEKNALRAFFSEQNKTSERRRRREREMLKTVTWMHLR
jgi:hypothetical protein